MKQPGFIDCLISSVGIDEEMAETKYTPAGYVPLVKNEDGVPVSGSFNYSSNILMLIYIYGHTHIYIAFSINCFSRYMFCPNNLHEYTLKQIGGYFKQTRNHGLILNTNREIFSIDSYPNADFSGMYEHEKPADTSFFKSRTGYKFTFSDCPILGKSKLHTETSLSTMEEEIFDLAHNCR